MAATLRIAGTRVRVRLFPGGVFDGGKARPYTVTEDAGRISVNIDGRQGRRSVMRATVAALAEVFAECDAMRTRRDYATKVYIMSPTPTPTQAPGLGRTPFVGDVD